MTNGDFLNLLEEASDKTGLAVSLAEVEYQNYLNKTGVNFMKLKCHIWHLKHYFS